MATAISQAIDERGLPANVDAERSILGAILLDNSAYLQTSSVLLPDDFSLDAHRKIYERIADMQDRGRSIDLVTLAEELNKHRELESVGGYGYLALLTDGLPKRSSIEHYVNIIRDKAMLRSIFHMARRAAAAAIEQADPATVVLEEVQQSIIDMIYHGEHSGVDISQAGRDTIEQMERALHSDRICIGVPTGLDELDELTTGFRAKEFYVVGARPGNGKTAWMCQAVRAAVQKGHRPGVFSIEVDRNQIITRLACQEANLHVFDTRDPRCMSESQRRAFKESVAEVALNWNWFLEDSYMTPKKLAAIARMWVSRGCDCIFVDYLGQLAQTAPGKIEYERVTNTAAALWQLARFVGVPVVALCQLKRGDGSEPSMEDLRSSGEIEQRANAVILLHRPVEVGSDGDKHFSGEDKIIVAKQRSGPAGMHIPVRFDGPIGMFRSR